MKKINVFLIAGTMIGLVACTSPHVHQFAEAWTSDATNHWHICEGEGCEEKDSVGEHEFEWIIDSAASYSADGSKHEECSVCHYAKEAVAIPKLEHNYATTWSSDANGHWHACIDEGFADLKKDEGQHEWKEIIDKEASYAEKGSKHNVCTVCGYASATQEIPMLTHNFATAWSSDANGHWHACTDKGYEDLKGNEGPHRWGEAQVVTEATASAPGTVKYTCLDCGYERTDELLNKTLRVETEDARVTKTGCPHIDFTENDEAKAGVYLAEPTTNINNRGVSFVVYSAEEQTVSYKIRAAYEYAQSTPTAQETFFMSINNRILSKDDAEASKEVIAVTSAERTSHTAVDASKMKISTVGDYKLRAGYNLIELYNNGSKYNYLVLDYLEFAGTKGLKLAGGDQLTKLIKDCGADNLNCQLVSDHGSTEEPIAAPYFGSTTGTAFYQVTLNATKATNVMLGQVMMYRTNTQASSSTATPYKNNTLDMCKLFINDVQVTKDSPNGLGAMAFCRTSDAGANKDYGWWSLAMASLKEGANTIRVEFNNNAHGNQNVWKLTVQAFDAGSVTIA